MLKNFLLESLVIDHVIRCLTSLTLFLFSRCLCTVSKVAGKGARVVEYLIRVFFKRLDALGFDNKQVGAFLLNF